MSEEPDLMLLESALLQAIVDRRWDLLTEVLDDAFVITTGGWLDAPADKAQWIRDVAAMHELHGFAIESVVQPLVIDDLRVALVLSTQTVTWQGERRDFRFRYTDIWRRHDVTWLLAVRHASIVPGSG